MTWEVRPSTSSSFSALSTLGLPLGPAGTDMLRVRTDLDRRPGGIRFAAYSFTAGSSYEFRVTARYETSSLTVPRQGGVAGGAEAQAPQFSFNLTVSPPAPPTVRIVGPSSVSDACGFTLDASSSFDTSVPPGTTADLAARRTKISAHVVVAKVFAWSCTSASASNASTYDCSQLPNLGTTAKLTVAGGVGEEPSHLHTKVEHCRRASTTSACLGALCLSRLTTQVQVSRTGGGAASSEPSRLRLLPEVATKVWPVEVSSTALPPVAIAVPWGAGEVPRRRRWSVDGGQAVSTQVGGAVGNPSASIEGGGGLTEASRVHDLWPGCVVPSTWAWRFALLVAGLKAARELLVQEDGSDIFLAFLNTTTSSQSDVVTVATTDFRGSALVPGGCQTSCR